MDSPFRGCIDLCTQNVISGWATASNLEIYLNGERLCQIESGGTRPDLVAAGIPAGRTFYWTFPKSLWFDDRISIRLPDDTRLVPSEQVVHTVRLSHLLNGVDLTKAGLEFGPLNRPIVPRERAQVYYVDHETQAGLRQKYAKSLGEETSKIPIIDYVWADGCSLCDVVGNRKFGWALASHVGEHIADFIGWINQLAEVLNGAGRVSLALPHRDRTFDACRPLSTFEDLVAAHIMKLNRPSPHQVLEHMLGVSEFWRIDLRKSENLAELKNAINVAKCANEGAYVDIHCHVFTPESFQQCYSLIMECGLTQLTLESVTSTDRDEFFVKLRK